MCFEWFYNMLATSWVAQWRPSDELRAEFPKRHTDYRDSLPPDMQSIANAYADQVHDGRWTFGLLEMVRIDDIITEFATLALWGSCPSLALLSSTRRSRLFASIEIAPSRHIAVGAQGQDGEARRSRELNLHLATQFLPLAAQLAPSLQLKAPSPF